MEGITRHYLNAIASPLQMECLGENGQFKQIWDSPGADFKKYPGGLEAYPNYIEHGIRYDAKNGYEIYRNGVKVGRCDHLHRYNRLKPALVVFPTKNWDIESRGYWGTMNTTVYVESELKKAI